MRYPVLSVVQFLREQKNIPKRVIKIIYRRVKVSVREKDECVSGTALRSAFDSEVLFETFKEKASTHEYREAFERFSKQATEARKLSDST